MSKGPFLDSRRVPQKEDVMPGVCGCGTLGQMHRQADAQSSALGRGVQVTFLEWMRK